MSKKKLYTIEDCDICEEALDILKDRINSGEIEVLHCNPEADGSSEEFRNCYISIVENIEAYPSLVDEDGYLVDIKTNKRLFKLKKVDET